jgi:hypothetical protein
VAPALLALAVALGTAAGCVRDHELFSPEIAGASGAGTAEPEAPWKEAQCVAALSAGKTGDPCVGKFECTGSLKCCETLVTCDGVALEVSTRCDLCASKCSVDSDCDGSQICELYQCQQCPKNLSCPPTWQLILRHGCTVCVPPNDCGGIGGPGCPAPLSCVAGLTCLPGCNNSPECCFGNQCADPSCGPPKNADCARVGCPDGTFCKVAGPPVSCACDPMRGAWVCEAGVMSACASL